MFTRSQGKDTKTLYDKAGRELFKEGKPRPEGTSWQAKMKQEGYDAAKQAADSALGIKQTPDREDGGTKEPQGTPEGDEKKIDEIKKEEGQ